MSWYLTVFKALAEKIIVLDDALMSAERRAQAAHTVAEQNHHDRVAQDVALDHLDVCPVCGAEDISAHFWHSPDGYYADLECLVCASKHHTGSRGSSWEALADVFGI